MTKNLKLFNFEGRYEKSDDDNFRYFEVTQLKNGGFLIVGTKFDVKKGSIKPFTMVLKGSKDEKSEKYKESLEKVKLFISGKIERNYVKTGGIEKLAHPTYRYSDEIVSLVKKNKIEIIDSMEINKIKVTLSVNKSMDLLFD